LPCGDDRDLDPPALHIEDRIGGISLSEDLLVLGISGDGSSDAFGGQKNLEIERTPSFASCGFNSLRTFT
jgi:hypothetical protein